MNPQPTPRADHITVLVFKDNYAARTFQVSTRWISKLAILLGISLMIAVTSIILVVKYKRMALKFSPSRIQELEQEVAELRASQKEPEVLPTPVEGGNSVTFSGFPDSTPKTLPDPKGLKFVVQPPKISWKNNILNVHFALQYTRDDQKSQQGRIIVLARGTQTLLAYPKGVFQKAGASALINVMQGESFSVSRFREVNAELGPVASPDLISEIEIFILSKEGQILTYQKLSPTEANESAPSE